MDIWREIPGFTAFRINQYGRVFRVQKRGKPVWREVKPDLSSSYPKVALCVGNVYHKFTIHHLVCTVFVGPRPTSKHEVNHKDGKKDNNYYENLEWLTHQQNVKHRFEVLGHKGANLGRKFSPEWKAKVIKTLHWYGK